jgi:hypothetical protein
VIGAMMLVESECLVESCSGPPARIAAAGKGAHGPSPERDDKESRLIPMRGVRDSRGIPKSAAK